MLETSCYKISNNIPSCGISGPFSDWNLCWSFMLLLSQGKSKDKKFHNFLLIIYKMLQLISAGIYILNEKAFKYNVATKRLEEGDAEVNVPVNKPAKWVFIVMVVSNLKIFFFSFSLIYIWTVVYVGMNTYLWNKSLRLTQQTWNSRWTILSFL